MRCLHRTGDPARPRRYEARAICIDSREGSCDDSEQREVKARLRQLLLTDEIPDPRDVALICLIDACHLLGLVLTPDEIRKTADRVEQLSKMDLIGQAVMQAVAEIRFLVRNATPPAF